jgi:hypothetical protein
MILAEACPGTFVTLKGACGKTTTTYLAFQFLSPSVLLSCYHHLKAKNGMYFCPSIFEHFRMVCLGLLGRIEKYSKNCQKTSLNLLGLLCRRTKCSTNF